MSDKTLLLTQRVCAWFDSLDERRGRRAELRRAATPADALLCPEAWLFVDRVDPEKTINRRRLAEVSALLVHFKEHCGGKSLARQMAEKEGDRPRVSDLRFRRLLTSSGEQLFSSLRRLIPLIDKQGNLVDLIQAYCYWNEKQRIRWAQDYYEHVVSVAKK